jgi:hypothetical protein
VIISWRVGIPNTVGTTTTVVRVGGLHQIRLSANTITIGVAHSNVKIELHFVNDAQRDDAVMLINNAFVLGHDSLDLNMALTEQMANLEHDVTIAYWAALFEDTMRTATTMGLQFSVPKQNELSYCLCALRMSPIDAINSVVSGV